MNKAKFPFVLLQCGSGETMGAKSKQINEQGKYQWDVPRRELKRDDIENE